MYWPYPFYGSYSPERLARELLYPNPLFESRMIGDYLKEQTKPDDRIYVFGSEPQIYFYADRLAATPHIFVFPLTLFPRDPAQIDAELARLSSGAPKFIVYVDVPASILIGSKLGERFRNGVLELLGRRYRWVGAVDMRGPESKAVFVSGEDESIGTVPNWTAEPQLFVFERR